MNHTKDATFTVAADGTITGLDFRGRCESDNPIKFCLWDAASDAVLAETPGVTLSPLYSDYSIDLGPIAVAARQDLYFGWRFVDAPQDPPVLLLWGIHFAQRSVDGAPSWRVRAGAIGRG
jgi:hypothetical protein